MSFKNFLNNKFEEKLNSFKNEKLKIYEGIFDFLKKQKEYYTNYDNEVNIHKTSEYNNFIKTKLKHFSNNYSSFENHPLLDHYSNNIGSKKINQYLIDRHKNLIPKNDSYEKYATGISNHLKTAEPISKTSYVYAGTGKWNINKDYKEGDTIHTPAFTSTSVSPHISHFYNTREGMENKIKNVLKFKLPEGSNHGAFLGHLYDNEDLKNNTLPKNEFLLNKNQNWKLHKTSVKKDFFGNNYYEHELHPHPLSPDFIS
jgi:hypothetical protein